MSFIHQGDPPYPATYSPIDLVGPDHPPTFVLVATADTLIYTSHSYDYFSRLKENGVECDLKEATGMEHGKCENGDLTDEGIRAYEGWWEEAIRPGLDWVLARMGK
jgi:acetyl esterase/lipase